MTYDLLTQRTHPSGLGIDSSSQNLNLELCRVSCAPQFGSPPIDEAIHINGTLRSGQRLPITWAPEIRVHVNNLRRSTSDSGNVDARESRARLHRSIAPSGASGHHRKNSNDHRQTDGHYNRPHQVSLG